jgi:hypothetical protein
MQNAKCRMQNAKCKSKMQNGKCGIEGRLTIGKIDF